MKNVQTFEFCDTTSTIWCQRKKLLEMIRVNQWRGCVSPEINVPFLKLASFRATSPRVNSNLKIRYLWNQTSYKKSTHTKSKQSSRRFIFRPQTPIKCSRTCRKRPRNVWNVNANAKQKQLWAVEMIASQNCKMQKKHFFARNYACQTVG